MKRGQAGNSIISLLIIFMVIPSQNFAATTFRVDMDANTPGLQTELWVMPGDSFTTNIELVLTDAGDSISSFGFSLWWDADEMNITGLEDIVSTPVNADWTDLSYLDVWYPLINNFAQISFISSEGPLTAVIASIDWKAGDLKTDSFTDITPGYYSMFDEAHDKNGETITPAFEGGTVNVAPEPASPMLFLSGIGALTARHWRRKKRC